MSLKKLESELSIIKEVYEQKPPYKHVSGFYPFEQEEFISASAKPVSITVKFSIRRVREQEAISASGKPVSAKIEAIKKRINVDEKEALKASGKPVSATVISIKKQINQDDKDALKASGSERSGW